MVVHASIFPLMEEFLQHKRQHGTDIEKEVYENMTSAAYLNRLLVKRPIVFYTPHDVSILRNGAEPPGIDWRRVGSGDEGAVRLTEYLSYDEMQLSTLIGVSSPTYFINKGDRHNKGLPADRGTYQEYGIFVGLTGARFEHLNLVESQHVIISVEWSTSENGYGAKGQDTTNRKRLSIWAALYNQGDGNGNYFFPSHDEAVIRAGDGDPTLHQIITDKSKAPLFFNIPVYKQRIRFPLECLLLEANARAENELRTAYVHIVGLGLGSWQVCNEQAQWMLDVCAEVVTDNRLSLVSVINFSWFPEGVTCGGTGNEETLVSENGNSIKILFNKRNVADPLTEEHQDKLLVACYPWDGNSFPGNEYWRGLLMVSGDPAAASCSAIAELQNPFINRALNSNNLFVARLKEDVTESSESTQEN